MKNECKIVRDLFPNYIEERISNETKEYVEEHIKNCKSCAEILHSITRRPRRKSRKRRNYHRQFKKI